MTKNVRSKARMLSDEDRVLVRELYKANLTIREELVKIDFALCDLMNQRDELMREAIKTHIEALANKFDVSKSHIIYVCRPREAI